MAADGEEATINAAAGGYGVAAFDFTAEQDGEISFEKGEIIRVDGDIDAEWKEGTVVGRDATGAFPATFITALQMARAVDDFSAEHEADLAMKKGDVVAVVRRIDDEWLEGTHPGSGHTKIGMFPRDFVELLPPSTGLPWASVTHPFKAEHDSDLALHPSDVVLLTGRPSDEWLSGICCGQTGTFPDSFVKIEVELAVVGSPGPAEPLPQLPPAEEATADHEDLPALPPDTTPPMPKKAATKPPAVAAKPSITPPPMTHAAVASAAAATAAAKPPPAVVRLRPKPEGPSKPRPPSIVGKAAPAKKAPPPKPATRPPPRKRTGSTERGPPPPKPAIRPPKPTRKGSDKGPRPAKPTRPGSVKSKANVPAAAAAAAASGGGSGGRGGDAPPVPAAGGDVDGITTTTMPAVDGGRGGKQPRRPTRRASLSVTKPPLSRPNSMQSTLQAVAPDGGEADVRRSANLEAQIDLLEKEIIEATDTERGCVALLEHMQSASTADAAAMAEIELQLEGARVELDKLEAALLEKQKKRDKRAKVIAEIFDTEEDMANDLTQCVKGYCSADSPLRKAIGETDFELLFCNIADVARLSAKLAQAIRDESLKPVPDQQIGGVFCKTAPALQEAYVKYVVNFDEANELQIRLSGDERVTAVMKQCHAKIAHRTKAWDLPNLIIKPVQRVLKYPLLMRELEKRTPEDHSDRPNTLKAAELLTQIATAINEGRRTKELVGKYTEKRDKLNPHGLMHSMAKKGMRLNQRLRDRMQGRDDDKAYARFNAAAKEFQNTELLCKKLQQRVEEYLTSKSRSALALNELILAARSVVLTSDFKAASSAVKAPAAAESNKVLAALKKIATYTHTLVKDLQSSGDTMAELMQCFTNPNKLISKRADKKLDAESFQRKFQAAAKDPERQLAMKADVDLAENNFQALNRQLEEDLPRLTGLTRATLLAMLKTLATQENVFAQQCVAAGVAAIANAGNADSSSRQVSDLRGRLTATVQSLIDSQNLFDFKDLCRDFGGLMPKRGPTFSMPKRPISTSSVTSRSSSTSSLADESDAGEPAVDKFANALCQWEYTAESATEVTLTEGESVAVLSRSDNMGNSEWWNVRKSDGTEGFVPAAFLAEVAPDGMLVIKEEAPASADDIAQMAAFTKVLMMAPAEFDFEGEAEIELTVVAGDMLEVLHLEDLTGNDEWCLVQNDKGHRGFVPKSFVALPA